MMLLLCLSLFVQSTHTFADRGKGEDSFSAQKAILMESLLDQDKALKAAISCVKSAKQFSDLQVCNQGMVAANQASQKKISEKGGKSASPIEAPAGAGAKSAPKP